MKKRVLISGGTGLVGRFMVEDCLNSGFDVSVMGRTTPSPGMFSQSVDFRHGTLDPDARRDHLFDDVTHFVHGAFQHVPGKYRGGEGNDPAAFWCANVDGSIALFDAAKNAGVSRCVFLSSRAAYPPVAPGAMLDEAMQGEPASLYGKAKLAVEQRLEQMRDDEFVGVSLRITGVYGAHRAGAAHKWQQLFSDYLAGEAIVARVASEVHGFDVASAVRLMLDLPKARIEHCLYNVSDIVLDRHDLLSVVAEYCGSLHPLPERADENVLNLMKTERLQALGWCPGGMAALRDRVIAPICH